MTLQTYSDVAASDWSWGALIFDADNDALPDMYVCNGIYHDVTDQDFIDFFANDIIQNMVMTGKKEQVDEIVDKMSSHPIPNKAFKNLGNLKFADAGKEWGFNAPSFSNGAAYGDLDNDGDLDLVVNNVNEKAFIYKNNAREINKNNYLAVFLKGSEKNTFAVGSEVKVYVDSQVLSRQLVPSRGFQSSIDYKMIFGIGKASAVDSVVIIWPNRTTNTFLNLRINEVNIIQQTDSAQKISLPQQKTVNTILGHVISEFDKHEEDDHIDFYYERNIPKMLSREGPHAACADVNGDGLIDIYIAGALQQPGQLYLQTAIGISEKKRNLV